MDLTVQTPAEIDTALATLYGKLGTAQFYLDEAKGAYRVGPLPAAQHAVVQRQVAERRAAVDALLAEIHPREAEYLRRGWSRFFLVTNGNGHVHRDRHCSTCFPRTRYAWVTALSGATEAQAVAEYGEQMCTVCFPSAPAQQGPSRVQRERDAATAAREAKRAEKAQKAAASAIANPDGTPLRLVTDFGTVRTVATAKQELTGVTGCLLHHQPGSRVAQRIDDYRADQRRLAVALAHKLGGTPEQYITAAEKRAR